MINERDLCTQNMGNTGIESCGINLEKIVGVILMPDTLTFDAAKIATDATLITALQTAVLAAKTSRAFPILKAGAIVGVTDNTPEATMDNAEYGDLMGVFYQKHNFTLRMGNNGMYLMQQLYKYMGNRNVAAVFIDAKGKILFKKYGTGAKGIPCQVITDQYKLATGTAAGVQNVRIILNDTDALMDNDKLLVFPLGNTVELSDLIHGIHDVVLSQGSGTNTASALYVKAMLPASYVDFGLTFKTEIETNDGNMFNVYDITAPTTPITVSGVTVDAAGQIILASSAAFTSGHSFYVSLKTPAELAALVTPLGAATTGGYESNVLTVAVP
jgi:hypothetical protein